MNLDFKWVGEPISVDVVDKQLTSKPRTFYKKCQYEGKEYSMGDHVMISNSEASDPESVEHCYVATLVFMYEMKSNKRDPYRAQVQWYSRLEQLPKKKRPLNEASINPPLNESWELIHEGKMFKGDISLETIFNKCSILHCDVSKTPNEIGKQNKTWIFFCRFELAPKRQFVPFKGSENQSTGDAELFSIKKESEKENIAEEEGNETPRKRRSVRTTPARYTDYVELPSPLKNAKFSATKSTKDLCIIIHRESASKHKDKASIDQDASTPVKARKKLNLENTPSKLREKNEKTPSKRGGKRSAPSTPSSTQKRARLAMTPTLSARSAKVCDPTSPLGEIRRRLHVSAVPQTLPCREDEFHYLFSFVEGKLADGSGGCMYVSGVPGTGKTATVNEVVRMLRESQTEGDLPDFKLIQVNGMKLTAPNQIYVQIWEQLTGNKVTADKAVKLLQSKFSTNGPRHLPTVLIVDELDLLWTRQQDVLYNIFEWPNRPKAQLTVLAIANTMDLPERLLINRVASRMGLTRLTFQPYKVKQLQSIISSRLEDMVSFEPEAVEFIARKVSAASGDARRALDIARRAAELAEKPDRSPKKSPSKRGTRPKSTVTMLHVQAAVEEMFSSPKLLAIQACSLHEQFFLNALVQEYNRTGVEESVFDQVIRQHFTLCDLEGMARPNISQLLSVCASLSSSRLILTEHGRHDIRQKIRLNTSIDDVTYALKSC